MRIPRLVLISLAAPLLPFMLTGCSRTTIVNDPGSPGDPQPGGSSSTAAFVYVVNQSTTSSPNQLVAFTADANGILTAVPGSPFDQDVTSIAANGKFLMASENSQPDINTYTIASNGALTLATQFNYAQDTGYKSSMDSTCGAMSGLLFDHTGQSLYAAVGNINCSSNNAIASFAVDPSTGSLGYLGNVNIGYNSSPDIAFLGTNDFAYSAFPGIYWSLMSFERTSNGMLNRNTSFTSVHLMAAPPGSTPGLINGYTPGLTATDAANHVAIAEYPDFTMNGAPQPVQLASYTADAKGNLSTNDTYATMPPTSITTPLDLEISSSGSLLAVGGVGGLQVFHFNGASSITGFTSLLTADSISGMAWDNNNHLYAFTLTGTAYGKNSVSPGKLHVFTVTDTAASEAPGSPYTIATPVAIAVQPATAASTTSF
jgi:hypothetical protein